MLKVEVHRGDLAERILGDPAWLSRWEALCARCPWATTYQRPAFLATWYRVYAQSFEPILVTGTTESGELAGLVCLSASRAKPVVQPAGAAQAEYQTWIADPALAENFPLRAIEAVRQAFPADVLEFRYLPPGVPLDWLSHRRVRPLAVLTEKHRPLLRFADMEQDSLNKANNKKRLKVLKRHGEIEFSRVDDEAGLARTLDEMAPYYDLRLGAMHGHEPFRNDPLKKQFQIELMKQPGLLHVTMLRVGQMLAAAHVNVRDGKQLHLNLISYNPLLAKHSPGKFHIHLLAQMLVAEGCEEIDLTPGGDPYKERFANAHDSAYILSFHPNRRSRRRELLATRNEAIARWVLGKMKIHPARARDFKNAIKRMSMGEMFVAAAALAGRGLGLGQKMSLYGKAISPEMVPKRVESPNFRRDRPEDLLLFTGDERKLPRKDFLLDALSRLEQGQHLYSCVSDGQLRYVGWLMERPSDVFVSRVLPGLSLPTHCALIMGLQSLTHSADTSLSTACLSAMLQDLSTQQGMELVVMQILPTSPLRSILESAGFTLEPADKFAQAKTAKPSVDPRPD